MTTPSDCAAWAQVEDLPAEFTDLFSPDEWCRHLTLATDILYSATMRRWRGEPRTATAVLRPAPDGPRPPVSRDRWGAWPHGYTTGGALGWPVWGWTAGGPLPRSVRLPHNDVTVVTSVLIDGEPFAAWESRGAWLDRRDGRGWPVCDDRTTVTYLYGRRPPQGGVVACAELATELGREERGDEGCRLPARTTSVQRQGVSFDITDPQEYLNEGRTGVTPVDMWIRSVNPYGRAQEATVWSPDIATARRLS